MRGDAAHDGTLGKIAGGTVSGDHHGQTKHFPSGIWTIQAFDISHDAAEPVGVPGDSMRTKSVGVATDLG